MCQLVAISYCCGGVTLHGLPCLSSAGCRVPGKRWVLELFSVPCLLSAASGSVLTSGQPLLLCAVPGDCVGLICCQEGKFLAVGVLEEVSVSPEVQMCCCWH